MNSESHWALLDRIYRLPFNRAGLDLLVHILSSWLLVKFENSFYALMSGTKNHTGGNSSFEPRRIVPIFRYRLPITPTSKGLIVPVQSGSVVNFFVEPPCPEKTLSIFSSGYNQ